MAAHTTRRKTINACMIHRMHREKIMEKKIIIIVSYENTSYSFQLKMDFVEGENHISF